MTAVNAHVLIREGHEPVSNERCYLVSLVARWGCPLLHTVPIDDFRAIRKLEADIRASGFDVRWEDSEP